MDDKSQFDTIARMQHELSAARLGYWSQHSLFSFNWRVPMLFLALAWFIWRRLEEMLFMGGTVFFAALKLDVLGTELGLWDYSNRVLPRGSRLFTADAAIPVFCMYLWFASRVSFFCACTVLAVVPAFTGIGWAAKWVAGAAARRSSAWHRA